MATELEKINQIVQPYYIRDKNGRLTRNPNYKEPEHKKEEVKKQEEEKKQVIASQEPPPKQDIKVSQPPKPAVFQKAVEKNGTSTKIQEYEKEVDDQSSISSQGISGDKILEPIPEYIQASCEKVLQGENNSFIVFGRDRPGTRISGYGGKGDTKCGSIDIVAGRIGYESRKVDEINEQIWVDPNLEKDACRIYISQKTDVDENFKLAKGKVGVAKTKSAIAIKADGIRIIGREGIKIVSGVDKYNSQGSEIKVISGIDLIANNDDSNLQSIPKGQNLKEALDRLTVHVDKLNGIVDAFLMSQMEYNKQIMSHFHYSPFFGMPTTPSMDILMPAGAKCMLDQLVKVKKSLVAHKKNLASFKLTYLSVYGKKYINSRHNNVN